MENSNEETEGTLKSPVAREEFIPEFDATENNYVSYCTDNLIIDAPEENLIYANWAATADYACEFVYNNRAIRRDGVVSRTRVKNCGENWIWKYVHGD